MNFMIERLAGKTTRYTFEEPNKRGEHLIVDVTEARPDNTDKRSLPNLWQKHGCTKKRLESYFSVATYATDAEGVCLGRYNPQVKVEAVNGKPRAVINFDWMLEVSAGNLERLMREIYRRFVEAME